MAAILILMEKGNGRMLVKPEKLAEYLAAGWVEIERVPMSGADNEPAPMKKSIEPEAKTAKNSSKKRGG